MEHNGGRREFIRFSVQIVGAFVFGLGRSPYGTISGASVCYPCGPPCSSINSCAYNLSWATDDGICVECYYVYPHIRAAKEIEDEDTDACQYCVGIECSKFVRNKPEPEAGNGNDEQDEEEEDLEFVEDLEIEFEWEDDFEDDPEGHVYIEELEREDEEEEEEKIEEE